MSGTGSKGGVSKQRDGKPAASSNAARLQGMEEMANRGFMSHDKINSGTQQASISHPAGEVGPQPVERHPDQAQTQVQQESREAPEDQPPPSQLNVVVESIETRRSQDIEMQELSPSPGNEPRPSAGDQDVREQDGPPQSPTDLSTHQQDTGIPEDTDCLAIITKPERRGPPKSNDSSHPPDDDNYPVDGWGTFRGSTFVILQIGAYHFAKYIFKFRKNYVNTNDKMHNISDKALRLSLLEDRDSRGKKTFRYSRENIVGVYGITSEARKENKVYKRDACVWVKIKWKGIADDDTKTLSGGCSWIPRSDLVRFCGGQNATKIKLKEVWDKQEERFLKWNGNEPGKGVNNRSPTPFPLDTTPSQYQQRRTPSRLNTSAEKASSSSVPAIVPPPPSRQDERKGPQTRPVDPEQANCAEIPPVDSAKITANQSAPGSEAENFILEYSKEEFMEQKAKEDKWDQADPTELEKLKVKAEALYKIYKATMLKSSATREVVKEENQHEYMPLDPGVAAH